MTTNGAGGVAVNGARGVAVNGERGFAVNGERGFALVAVLLVLGLLGIIGAEFAYSMRLEASAMRAWRDNINAGHLAEAAVEQALRELSGDVSFVGEAPDGLLTFYDQQRAALPRLARRGRLGPGEFAYRITDEQARINVNNNQQRLDKLLQCLAIEKKVRDQIVDSILDWIDPNEEHRLSGAESDDYYLTLPTPYRARNAPIESVNELLQIKGVTPALFGGGPDGKPGLVDVFTAARAAGQVNVNTAPPVVLCAMGASEAEISSIVQGRRLTPYQNANAALGNPGGFTATSQTFRIEAEGLIDGRPRANLMAIVQRQASPNVKTVILEWSGVR